MSHGGGGALVTGGAGGGGGVLQHRRGKERVRRKPLASHVARRTRLTEGAEGRRRQWRGSEATGDDVDMLGGGAGRHHRRGKTGQREGVPGTARMRRLRAAPTVAGGARLVGAAGATANMGGRRCA
jgi:hypothetical protein